MCDIDGVNPACETRIWRTARKDHVCCACIETITSGDRYHITSGIWDGNPERFKHCARCWKICEALWKEGSKWIDFELNCGETWDDVFGEPSTEIASLAFALPSDFTATL